MPSFRHRTLALACCALLAGTAGVTAHAAPVAAAHAAGAITANPFYKASTLPFEAPDFSKIKNADFQPAIEEGMKLQRAEIEKIATNPATPTFENTIVAMEKTGAMLNRVMQVFGLLACVLGLTLLRRHRARVARRPRDLGVDHTVRIEAAISEFRAQQRPHQDAGG